MSKPRRRWIHEPGVATTVAAGVSLLLLAASQAAAQTVTNAIPAATTEAPTAVADEAPDRTWSFSASAYAYLVPDSREYVQPTVTADRGWLHLEARYNYEDLETGSAWVGYNLRAGEKWSLEFTPMLGGVFGDTTGIAPGYKFALGYWKLELSSESEYVFDTGNSAGSFFYTWSELALAPTDWLRFGLAAQRTRAYQSDREVQRGFLIGLAYRRVNFTTYVFNPGESRPTLVLALGVEF